tara:strand:+ start:5773 stop:6876 length:1104 start_codon:yes stop_codon:yes gene_type:complete
MIREFKKIVIKIGSTSIVDSKTKKIKSKWLVKLCKDIAFLHKTKKIVIVCSGAIALGSKSISKSILRKLEDKQAAASIGQIELAHQWRTKLKKFKINVSQILLTIEDSEVRRRYLNAKNTISSLQNKGVIPIINENDTVATEEIRYGDNDKLAARVAQMIEADLLILLSDVDGLYEKNPKKIKDSKKINEIYKIDKKIENLARGQASKLGSGGMTTKILAAKICSNNGCTTVITNSNKNNPVSSINIKNSTFFYPSISTNSSKKKWLLNHLSPFGSFVIDDGAKNAILKNKSLLPAGIIEIKGKFKRGDVISILNKNGSKVAIGISAYDFSDVKKIIGKKTKEISKILGFEGRDEVIHKDNLVKLST